MDTKVGPKNAMVLFLNILFWALSILVLVGTVLPLSKIPHGAVRGMAFLREQFFGCAIVFAIVMPLLYPNALGWGVAAALVVSAAINLIYIFKFTPLWTKQSVDATGALRDQSERHVSVLAINVKQSNRAYDRLIKLVRKHDPDMVLAVEVDNAWVAALKDGLDGVYPHWVEVAKDNSYGMCLMSRLALSQTEVRELITKSVPSIRTAVTLRNGDDFRLYVVHPEPPVINHDTVGRDSEIAMIGLEAKQDTLPAVVAGDLNDVAWSTTTRRFQRLSGLLDPRVGRGFYNTFSATMPWMRWPLDHLFHAPQFRLLEMARLEKVGSDHFPMWFVLALAKTEAAASDPGSAHPDEKHEVRQIASKERDRPREAIGTDWEKD
ncbi:MAG: endonuclease/exonuclease/phosphatase family protein [Sulfitobacter sp.]